MGSMAIVLNSRQVNMILCPGTHDSGSYGLDTSVQIQHTTGFFNFLNAFLGCGCVSRFLSNWSITQSMNILQQLQAGIRHFDLRITYANNEYYLTHSFVMELLSDVISQFQSFTALQPSEIIFIQISLDTEPVQDFTTAVQTGMWALWKAAFGSKIYPYNAVGFPIYGTVMKAKAPIFLFFDSPNDADVWDSTINDEWMNQSNVETEIADLNSWLVDLPNKSALTVYGIQFLLTPQTDIVAAGVFNGSSIQSITTPLQAAFPTFFTNNLANMKNFSFLEMDFPTPEMISTIINYNTSIESKK